MPIALAPLLAASVVSATAVARPADPVQAAYVVMADRGAVVRAVTTAAACPVLRLDGRSRRMAPRAAPATLPARPTASGVGDSKPSDFAVMVCEASTPIGPRRATVAGRTLLLPRHVVRRIVVIGDTGCRLKASTLAYQACNDPQAYPFARIAARAAAWRPDLVIHVGDYLYRENPCAAGHGGCAGSPWGYGWDSWRADFFGPAAALLAAAPWVVTRGNHESCNRGGQGWWRLLDPRPIQPGRDCIQPADDATGDWSPPYAVPLGGGAQVVVMDLSIADTKAIRPDDPRYAQLVATHDSLARLARGARFTFATDHYPILGVTIPDAKPNAALSAGNAAVRSTFGAVDPAIVPAGVDVLLAGHVHLWEHVGFGGTAPSQFVVGFSGTEEDAVPLPSSLPPGTSPIPGVTVRAFEAWTRGFGFMTFERTGARSWAAAVRAADGRVVRRCRIEGHRSTCGPEAAWVRARRGPPPSRSGPP
ncbi:metallophosphoesterase [Sphingomonas sp.]|uniref:metallophosphoesterase n=1 Tax=Sphingomonas sp. TaxID=28214 RepID=UPI0035BC357E